MGLHKQYLRVGQSARNKLFGINPENGFAERTGGTPLSMLISEQGKINHGELLINFYVFFIIFV